MEGASYWISRLESPDRVLLSRQEIEELNRDTLKKSGQMAEVWRMPEGVSGDELRGWLLYDTVPVDIAVKRYDSKGRRIKERFFEGLAVNLDLDGVEEYNRVRFGVVAAEADVRALPTDEAVLKRPGRSGFDTLQYSSVFPTEPVALLHTSVDKRWGFFQTPTVRGWIRIDKVAFGTREDVTPPSREPFLTVTGSLVRVYGDRALKTPVGTVDMGTVLYLSGGNGEESVGPWAVRFPQRGPKGELVWTEAYIRRRGSVHPGYLPYTRGNVIRQAFRMIGEGYGWGGKGGRRDCSEFIKDVFLPFGIKLPRNSRDQGDSGNVMARLDGAHSKGVLVAALKTATPGITLVTLKRHVMLHIGSLSGRQYVIHQVSGYWDGKRFKSLNRVVVSSLELGKRSREGPLKDRITSVTEVLTPEL
ncbi:MAG: SH3 domain-containing protein [Deltaproteobacteria bacterium]|nr:SH3 domain-containing protein [Deltaproteobacteria bacterium]